MTDTPTIHSTLAQSYLVYFIGSIVGLFADTVIGFDTYFGSRSTQIALIFFVIGTVCIIWAQYTSRHSHVHHIKENEKNQMIQETYFFKGPYRYMRNPTHLGIVLLVTGYTIVSGSLIFFGVTMIGYLISNVLFQRYEAILDRTYGVEYKKYQKKVPKIF